MSQNSNLEFTPAEYMIVSMARILKDAENVFMGVASNLPFFAIWLAKQLYNPELTWLNIPGKINPSPSHPPKSTVDFQLLKNSSSSLTLANIFDMSARGELDVAFLSGVQIDKFGNFNLSHIPDGERSSHTWFVLTYLLGFEGVRNYDGSWTEWGNLIKAPIEK